MLELMEFKNKDALTEVIREGQKDAKQRAWLTEALRRTVAMLDKVQGSHLAEALERELADTGPRENLWEVLTGAEESSDGWHSSGPRRSRRCGPDDRGDGQARTRLVVQGHAGYGPAGQDIVCAAASALVYALAETLAETGEGWRDWTSEGVRRGDGAGDCAGDFGLVHRGWPCWRSGIPSA